MHACPRDLILTHTSMPIHQRYILKLCFLWHMSHCIIEQNLQKLCGGQNKLSSFSKVSDDKDPKGDA